MRRAATWLLFSSMATAQQQAPTNCDADVDHDGVVSVPDLLQVLGAFGATEPSGAAMGDVNGDGQVTVPDILLVLAAFGTTGCVGGAGAGAGGTGGTGGTGSGEIAGGVDAPWISPGPDFGGGRVFGMGDIEDGQVGWGETGARDQQWPVQAPSFGSDVVAIGAGGHQTFALKRDGRVFAAGLNDGGQLGDGTTTDRYTAAAVSGLGTDTVELARGLFSSMVVRTAAGQIYGWGMNEAGELCHRRGAHTTATLLEELGSDNAALGAGVHHVFFIKSSGDVVGCGQNNNGALGDGSWQNRPTPTALPALGTDTIQISGGYGHSLALKSDGTVVVFGSNTYGQLGTGCTYNSRHQCSGQFDSNVPAPLDSLGTDNVMVGAGNRNSLVMKQDGQILMVGYGWMGCLGRGHSDSLRASSSSFVPAVIPGNDADNTMASLNSNSHHVLVLKADGSVAGWGAAGGGRLAGHGESGSASMLSVLGTDNVHVFSQYHFTVVLKTN